MWPEELPAGPLALSECLCRDADALLVPYKDSGNGTGDPIGHTSACVPLTVGWKTGL